MAKFKTANQEPNEVKENEYLRATVAKQAATLDYIAMMADVELPEDEEVGHNELEIQ